MNLIAFAGVVNAGQIKLSPSVRLPDKARVLIFVPNEPAPAVAHIFSPRLMNPAPAKGFMLEVIEEDSHAQ